MVSAPLQTYSRRNFHTKRLSLKHGMFVIAIRIKGENICLRSLETYLNSSETVSFVPIVFQTFEDCCTPQGNQAYRIDLN